MVSSKTWSAMNLLFAFVEWLKIWSTTNQASGCSLNWLNNFEASWAWIRNQKKELPYLFAVLAEHNPNNCIESIESGLVERLTPIIKTVQIYLWGVVCHELIN